MTGFVGTLATKLVQLKPYDPESKGIVERANRYLETSFLPGRTSTRQLISMSNWPNGFRSPTVARVRRIDGRPIDLVGPDIAAMLGLPPLSPTVETVTAVRLGRDYYVRVAGNDYSVDPRAIGQLVDVHAGLSVDHGDSSGSPAGHP